MMNCKLTRQVLRGMCSWGLGSELPCLVWLNFNSFDQLGGLVRANISVQKLGCRIYTLDHSVNIKERFLLCQDIAKTLPRLNVHHRTYSRLYAVTKNLLNIRIRDETRNPINPPTYVLLPLQNSSFLPISISRIRSRLEHARTYVSTYLPTESPGRAGEGLRLAPHYQLRESGSSRASRYQAAVR